MISLLVRLGGWVSGNLLKILMAIALCTIALHLRSEWMQLRSLVAAFDSGSFDLKKRAASLKEEVTQSLADVERKGFAELSGQIRDGEGGIAIRQMAIEAIGIPFTPDEFLKKSHLQIEIAALAQKVLYLKKLRVIVRAGDTLAVLKEECDDLNQSLASRMAELASP